MGMASMEDETNSSFDVNHTSPCLDQEKEPVPQKLHLGDSFYRLIRYY